MEPNSREAIQSRADARVLTWAAPLMMLFARASLAVVAQGVFAGIFALKGSLMPWRDAEPWLPVYATLIDAGCLVFLWRLTRREKIGLFDLVGFERERLGRDVLLGLALIPVSLVFILGGNYTSSWLVYGAGTPAYLLGGLPLPAVLYGVVVFPLLWGLTEQMTYNGYLVSRFQVLSRSTAFAVAIVAFVWAAQHAFMPLTFDAKFMVYRLLSPLPFSIFVTLAYLRLRRLIPFALAHALMDAATVLLPILLPLQRS